ncbi:MAG TPA: complex I NDUFA9 subunit family protein [Persephonella sp.]|uniref:NADH dehydrogenase n=1 Tax=Persephonella marina (strain DSM 14350 / EX-H1) TaxID=123214 RepID=C0QR41_PERMH|nr:MULTISPECIES: complex I NDUFA9 subunit family protein [Persephonella]ACO03593.1 NADH dehydrogenase [Persephonella marina EX-H1]HCB68888.1 complex I NDUFA9 subunit family protein [Persephonella sp.]
MKILVTGGTGFVGRYLVEELSKEHQLVLPTRDIKKAELLFSGRGNLDNIKIIHFQEDLDHTVRKYRPEVIINLLGILYENRKKGITFEKVHFEYTKKLVDAASDIGIKLFVQMSALGADPSSKSRYQRTKGVAEEYIRSSNINYIIHRPSIIMGREQKLFQDMKKFGKIMPLFLAPEGRVQPVHILDVRDCFLKSLDEEDEIFELCGDRVVTFKELFEFALKYAGYRRPVIQMPKIFFRFMLPFFKLLPEPPMTEDQYYMLQKDNVCSGKYRGVKELLGKIRNPFEF